MHLSTPAVMLTAASVFTVFTADAAPSSGQTPTYIAAGVDASDDSDHFHEFKPWAQYEAASGWGLRASWQHYSLHGWSSTGRSLYLTHSSQSRGLSSSARLGVNQTGGHSHLLGTWDLLQQLTTATSLGFSLERDVVNSQRGLQQGLTATTALAVLDHQFHPRFSVGVSAGSTWFSDNNRRDMLRSRWTLTLHEAQGLYSYLITRHSKNNNPNQGAYFAPERFREAALGLMWKKALTNQLVISANADVGRQYINGIGQHLWHWGLYLSAPHRAHTQWRIGLSTSRDHASNINGNDSSYRYTSATASLRIPF